MYTLHTSVHSWASVLSNDLQKLLLLYIYWMTYMSHIKRHLQSMQINCTHIGMTLTQIHTVCIYWLGLQRLHSSRQMAIWSQINTAANPFRVQPNSHQQHNKATEPKLHELQREINPNICVALESNGKTFGERPKPQEEVACRCSPIRENAGAFARCQHQSTWMPAERGSMGFAWSLPLPWTRRVKAIRHTSRYGRKASAQTHASRWMCAQTSGWPSVCASLSDKLRLQVTCSPLNTTMRYLLLTGTVHYCKHMRCRGGMWVCVSV